MIHIKTDILVIGAGSGGLSVAAGAAQMGANVVLVEAHEMGGDCLNFGCVPSKALLAAAKGAHAVKSAEKFGVSVHGVTIDYGRAMTHVRDTIAAIAPHDSQDRFEGLGVTVIRARAKFIGPRVVQAGEQTITARRIVIATGARAGVPPIPGLSDVPYLTNETLFSLTKAPDHLLIIGAGAIGLEMAQAHARLGVRVSVVEVGQVLPNLPDAARAILRDALQRDGIEIIDQTAIESVAQENGEIQIKLADRLLTGSHLLVAAGRKPNVDGLDLERAGIAYSPRGITVDDRLKTTNTYVYAIGDVIGRDQFTHVAGYHAGVVIRSALFGLPAKANNTTIPRVIYTDPEIATVGLTMDQARLKYGADAQWVQFDYSGSDRAIADGHSVGFAAAIIVRGRAVGAVIVGHQAGEMIHHWTYLITHREKISKTASMIAPYPSLHEINKRVVGAYFSPRLFDNNLIKRIVRFVQKRLP